MDITALEYFKIIAESGSLTKAAQQLHITQLFERHAQKAGGGIGGGVI